MRKLINVLFVAAGLLITGNVANAQQKFGHLNSDEIYATMPEAKAAQAALETMAKTKQGEIDKMITEYQAKLKAAQDKDAGRNYDQSGAMAKLYASKVAMEQTVEAVQIHGGYGFVKEYHVERLMRDAKITQIYEGTSEVQKIVISRGILNA